MPDPRKLPLVFTVLALPLALTTLRAQGPLMPAAPPAPTMKTLSELDAKLEKRTPISSLPFVINAPGSYYVTQNLAVSSGNGIFINANDVTVDLNGYTISSTANPPAGLAVGTTGAGRSNIFVRNGIVRGGVNVSGTTFTGSGFLHGVSFGSNARGIVITDIVVNGVMGNGIDAANDETTVVSRCVVNIAGGSGIIGGTISSCSAMRCGDTGIKGDVVTNSIGESVGSGVGVNGFASTTNSHGKSASGAGMSGNNVSNSSGLSVSGSGIAAAQQLNTSGSSTSGSGISGTLAQNCIGSSQDGTGVNVTTVNNCHGSTVANASHAINGNVVAFSRAANPSGSAINATTAIGCSASGTVTAANKFLGTP